MKMQPIAYNWKTLNVCMDDGEIVRIKAQVPQRRYANVAAKQFVDEAEYVLGTIETRSRASHSQYFCELNELFDKPNDE